LNKQEYFNPLNDVHLILVNRYKEMFEHEQRTPYTRFSMDVARSQGSPDTKQESLKIYSMLFAIEENIDKFPPDKSSRWIGYIQRYLIEQELTSVQAERDFSRPLFHVAYKELGYEIPEKIDVEHKVQNNSLQILT